MKLFKNKIIVFGGVFIFFLFLAVLLFWLPLFDNIGALQWDAREVHLTNLIFSSSVWHQGFLPLWTPYIFSGFPQIADLQVAVFYPINFLIGVFSVFNQKIVFGQLVFHYALAGSGMFLLARYLFKDSFIGIFAGVAYMLSGFMIGHSSHLGMQNTAAWLPTVFFLAAWALRGHSWRGAFLAGFVAGIMILAGHFQTAVFAFFALGLYFIFYFLGEWRAAQKPPYYQIAIWAIIAAMAFLTSAVQLLPTFELTKQSQRAGISLELAQTESLNPKSFLSIIVPNYQNVSEGDYHGPWDRTQNDLFLGKLVPIFALFALIRVMINFLHPAGCASPGLPRSGNINGGAQKINHHAQFFIFYYTALAAIALLYSLGSYGFLHRYFYLLPLFDKMRAPSNMMILFDFAMILLAAFGFSLLKTKLPPKYFRIIGAVAIILVSFELLPQAMASELLYARKNQEEIFKKPGIVENTLYEYSQLHPINQFKLYRVPELDKNLAQVFRIYDFGGYNPLSLQRQATYEDAMVKNPALVDLAGIKYLPCEYISSRSANMRKIGNLCINDGYFPKAFLTDQYHVIQKEQSADALKKLQNGNTLLLEEDPFIKSDTVKLQGDVAMSPIQNPDEIEFSARTNKDSLLFVSQTNYPGWKALVDGKETKIFQADHLFQAVVLEAGDHKVSFFFTSSSLKSGVFLGIMSVIIVLTAGVSFLFKSKNEQAYHQV